MTPRSSLSAFSRRQLGAAFARFGSPRTRPRPRGPGPREGTLPDGAPFAPPLWRFRVARMLRSSCNRFRCRKSGCWPGPHIWTPSNGIAAAPGSAFPETGWCGISALNAGLEGARRRSLDLGGWEEGKCEVRGHFTGHYLSASALMYASTGDASIKAKGDWMVDQLAQCQKALGGEYLSAFPLEFWDRLDARKPVWAPFYTIHKIMAGMYDMHQLTGNTTRRSRCSKGWRHWADEWTASTNLKPTCTGHPQD